MPNSESYVASHIQQQHIHKTSITQNQAVQSIYKYTSGRGRRYAKILTKVESEGEEYEHRKLHRMVLGVIGCL